MSSEQPYLQIPETKWLRYSDARAHQRNQTLRLSDIPVEHAVSLPVPTLRFGAQGYIQFAAPCLRRPEAPTHQSPPDRWWIFDARGGHLMQYALVTVVPFADRGEAVWKSTDLPATTLDIPALRQRLEALDAVMNRLTGAFFSKQPAAVSDTEAAGGLLADLISEPLRDQYKALAPDFFAWLAAANF